MSARGHVRRQFRHIGQLRPETRHLADRCRLSKLRIFDRTARAANTSHGTASLDRNRVESRISLDLHISARGPKRRPWWRWPGFLCHCARRYDLLTSATVHRGPRPCVLHRRFEGRPRARSFCANVTHVIEPPKRHACRGQSPDGGRRIRSPQCLKRSRATGSAPMRCWRSWRKARPGGILISPARPCGSPPLRWRQYSQAVQAASSRNWATRSTIRASMHSWLSGGRFIVGMAPSLCFGLVLLEQPAQLERRSLTAIGHDRRRTKAGAIDDPAGDRDR